MNNQRIVIIGFMGCGKTTVAQELAQVLNSGWVDLDALINKHERSSPQEIIERDGEAIFRERETWMLRKVLSSGVDRVIAVGGGAWTIPANRALITNHRALAVWLDAPFELCWKRIAAGSEARPLARSRETAQTLYDARRPIYALADVRISVSENEQAGDIATKVADTVLQQGANS